MKAIIITPLLLLFSIISISAADAPITTLQITIDYIETTPAIAADLLHGEKAPASSAEWHQSLRELLRGDSGKLVATLSVTTKTGQRATVESVKERMYATEYDPALGRKENSPALPEKLSGVDLPTPTSFEMRPVGARLEVDPVIGTDGKSIDLNLAPEITYDLGAEPQMILPVGPAAPGGGGEEGNASADRPVISTPKFYTMKSQTSTTVSDGGSAMVAVLMPPSDHETPDGEKRILCFVTARIVKG